MNVTSLRLKSSCNGLSTEGSERTTIFPVHVDAALTGARGARPACGVEPALRFSLPLLIQMHQARLSEDGGEGAAAVPESRGSPERNSALLRDFPSFLVNVLQQKSCPPYKIRGLSPCFK